MNDNLIQDELVSTAIQLILQSRFEAAIAILDKVIEEEESPFYAYQFRSICHLLIQGDSAFEDQDAMFLALSDIQNASGILTGFLRRFPDRY